MRLLYILFMVLSLASCKKVEEKQTQIPSPLPPKPITVKVRWLTEKTVKLKIDNHLSYQKGFESDSVNRY